MGTGVPAIRRIDNDPHASRSVAQDLRPGFGKPHLILRVQSRRVSVGGRGLPLRREQAALPVLHYRMPTMSGAEILAAVTESYPYPSARRVLSTATHT